MTGGRSNYIIHCITPERIGDMEQLYTKLYGREPLPGYYARKLMTGYTGIEFAGCIAYRSEMPVASLCLVPCYLHHNGSNMLIAQLTDGMTHPAERSKGLFQALAEAVCALAAEKGIQHIIGFPNQLATPLLLKAGWQQLLQLHRFTIPVWPSVKHALLFWNKPSTPVAPVFGNCVGCANSVLADGFAGIDRSDAYLRYKSFNHTIRIAINGASAWIKTGHEFFIGDMEVMPGCFEAMLRELYKKAQQYGFRQMHFQCSPGTGLYQLFSMKYKPIPSFPVVIKATGGSPLPEKMAFTFADIDIF